MNIYACKTSRCYRNLIVNIIINISIKLFLKQKYFPPLNNSLTKFQCHLINLSLLKKQVQVNHSVDFLMILISNKNYLSKILWCDQAFQSTVVIKKSISRSNNPFTIVFFTILRLWNIQWQIIGFTYPMMVNQRNRWYPSCHFKCLYYNFIIAW